MNEYLHIPDNSGVEPTFVDANVDVSTESVTPQDTGYVKLDKQPQNNDNEANYQGQQKIIVRKYRLKK